MVQAACPNSTVCTDFPQRPARNDQATLKMHYRWFSSNPPARIAFAALSLWTLAAVAFFGCKSIPPGGTIIETVPLGTVVDQFNRMQEENAEPAKFIVYMHEFELNKPIEPSPGDKDNPAYQYLRNQKARGFRLSPYGQDHVKQIARQLQAGNIQSVVVERSNTSKLKNSLYRYPVNYNDELDRQRRAIVVEALTMLGLDNAEEVVVVAPAYPAGLSSDQAAQAYQATLNGSSSSGNRNGQAGGQSGGQAGGGVGGFF